MDGEKDELLWEIYCKNLQSIEVFGKWMYFQIGLFFQRELQRIRDMFHMSEHECMFHMSVKKFGQIGIGMAYLHIFLITIHEIDTVTEVYFEPFLIPF